MIGIIYFVFSPRLIAYCENAPVFSSLLPPFECHPSQRTQVYTRKTPFGPNQITKIFSVGCDGSVSVRDQEYVDSQCRIIKN